MPNLRLCFEIDKSVGLAEDENGEKSEAYICVKADVKTYELEKEKYKLLQEGFRKITANQWGIEINKLTPITLNEYLDKTNEEDE